MQVCRVPSCHYNRCLPVSLKGAACPREQIRWCFLPPPQEKKSVRLTVLESEVFYLSTEQTAAWRSHGSASSPASPRLAAAALPAASPGCGGQEDGPHPRGHCTSSTSRVSGGGAFNIRPGSDLPAAVGQASTLPFPGEGRASPLPAQRQVAASAKRCSWWLVSPAAAISMAEPSTHPFSLLLSRRDIQAWRAAALRGRTQSCQGCVGLSGGSLSDLLSSIPQGPPLRGRAVLPRRDGRRAPWAGGCPDRGAWRLQSTTRCLC